MKICFIVGAYPTMKCGIGDYTDRLAKELSKYGNEIHVITSKKANNISDSVIIHNIIDEWNFNSCKKILDELKKIKPDVVNIQYPSDEYKNNIMINLLPIFIKRKIKCKVTITIHEYECYTIKRKIRNYLNFKKVDKIIVVEEEYIDDIKNIFKNKEIVYIPISSNIPRSNISQKDFLIQKYNLNGKKIISYFGFIIPSKGLDYLLKCISKIENTKLLIIGELDKNDEYHESLLKLINKLNIQDKVVITGFLKEEHDVADLLQISDACVLPFVNGVKKRNGSFLAAYNQRIPVITTHNTYKDENGIYYAKPNNEEMLLEKMLYVLNNKIEFNRDVLTWDKTAKKYIDCFK